MTNAEARFNKSLRPRKPEGSLGRTAQDVHLDSHTAPELCWRMSLWWSLCTLFLLARQARVTLSDSGLCRWVCVASFERCLTPLFADYGDACQSRHMDTCFFSITAVSRLLLISLCYWLCPPAVFSVIKCACVELPIFALLCSDHFCFALA